MGNRLDALDRATASLVLFLEPIPSTVRVWLEEQLTAADLESSIVRVDERVRSDVQWMNAHGLFHFDAHFDNILSDGRNIYLADFGLAVSTDFVLSEAEVEFLERNRSHDICYVVTQLTNWIVQNLMVPGAPPEVRNGVIADVTRGRNLGELPRVAAGVVARYAPVARVMNAFYWQLHGESRTTTYPREQLESAARACGLQ